jgi:ribonuclease HII
LADWVRTAVCRSSTSDEWNKPPITTAEYREAAAKALDQLGVSPGKAQVLLDAGLSVSRSWEQESFVKGDERIPVIALASIVAKVSRDRHMDELALEHAHYGFEQHKGYGTRAHYQAIQAHGMSTLHRRTFVHM